MDSLRKRILQNVVNAIQNVSEISAVKLGTFEPARYNPPCVGVIPLSETHEEETMEGEWGTATLTFIARIVANQESEEAGWALEDAIRPVQKAVLLDRTLGGIADNTRYVATRWLYLDADFPQAGADLEFVTEYSLQRADSSFS